MLIFTLLSIMDSSGNIHLCLVYEILYWKDIKNSRHCYHLNGNSLMYRIRKNDIISSNSRLIENLYNARFLLCILNPKYKSYILSIFVELKLNLVFEF